MGKPILQLTQISKSYGKKSVLKNVSLEVARGEAFGFLGPNGAGKTTLIRVTLGLVRPDQGEIMISGHRLQRAFREAIAHVGAVVETPKFFGHLSGYQNLQLVQNLHRNVSADRLREVLELTGLTDYADTKAGTYSLGMKQRLGIARALIGFPELIFLDEPMNGLDPQGIIEIRALINTLRHQGISFFITSHLLHEVEQVCDSIAIIRQGRIIARGQLSELLNQEGETVEIHTDQPEEAYAALEYVAFVKKRSLHAGCLLVDLYKGSSAQLNRFLNSRNIQVRYLIPKKHTLEDFFMERAHGEELL